MFMANNSKISKQIYLTYLRYNIIMKMVTVYYDKNFHVKDKLSMIVILLDYFDTPYASPLQLYD